MNAWLAAAWKDILERQNLLIAALLALPLVLPGALFLQERASARRVESLREQQQQFMEARGRYLALKAEVDGLEERMRMSPPQGVIKTLDDLFSGMGLRERIATLKPLESRDMGDFVIEKAEVTVKKTDLNEAVNLLYRLENAPTLIAVKQAEIKSSFAGHALDLRLTLSAARKKAETHE